MTGVVSFENIRPKSLVEFWSYNMLNKDKNTLPLIELAQMKGQNNNLFV